MRTQAIVIDRDEIRKTFVSICTEIKTEKDDFFNNLFKINLNFAIDTFSKPIDIKLTPLMKIGIELLSQMIELKLQNQLSFNKLDQFCKELEMKLRLLSSERFDIQKQNFKFKFFLQENYFESPQLNKNRDVGIVELTTLKR